MGCDPLITTRIKLGTALLKKWQLEKRLKLEKDLKVWEIYDEDGFAELEYKDSNEDNQFSVNTGEANTNMNRCFKRNSANSVRSGELHSTSKDKQAHEVKDTLCTVFNSNDLP